MSALPIIEGPILWFALGLMLRHQSAERRSPIVAVQPHLEAAEQVTVGAGMEAVADHHLGDLVADHDRAVGV